MPTGKRTASENLPARLPKSRKTSEVFWYAKSGRSLKRTNGQPFGPLDSSGPGTRAFSPGSENDRPFGPEETPFFGFLQGFAPFPLVPKLRLGNAYPRSSASPSHPCRSPALRSVISLISTGVGPSPPLRCRSGASGRCSPKQSLGLRKDATGRPGKAVLRQLSITSPAPASSAGRRRSSPGRTGCRPGPSTTRGCR